MQLLKIKTLLLTSICFLLNSAAQAQFVVNTNKTTGAVNQISAPGDQHHMNRIFASGNSYLTWQQPEEDRGLGKYNIVALGVKDEKWTTVEKEWIEGNKSLLIREHHFK